MKHYTLNSMLRKRFLIIFLHILHFTFTFKLKKLKSSQLTYFKRNIKQEVILTIKILPIFEEVRLRV